MDPVPIQVESYSGYKADESPRRFLLDSDWIDVEEVVDRWYQGNREDAGRVVDYFKVTGSDGHEYLLRHDREPDLWYLANRW